MVDRDTLENWGRTGLKVENVNDRTAIARQLNFFDLYLDTHDQSLAPCLMRDGYWESWISCWMIRNIGPGFTCIDVGANMGYYTFLMAYLTGPEGRVHAFEPQARYLQLLAQSAEANGREETVRLWPYAASDVAGWATLAIPGELGGSASIYIAEFDPKWGTQVNVEVPTITLDQAFDGQSVDLIKIDAEGAEPLVWRGMQQIVRDNDDLVVCMEWTASNWGAEATSDFVDEIHDAGMGFTRINTDGHEENVSREELLAPGDWQMMVLRKR